MRQAMGSAAMVFILAAEAAAADGPNPGREAAGLEGAGPAVSFSGQLRLRAEERHDLGADDAVRDGFSFVGQRARIGVSAALSPLVTVRLQMQDVRSWGEETNTLTDDSGDSLDLHQGYADVELPGGLVLRAGRQEIAIDGERLIGAVGWANQGRSFDGIRLRRKGHGYESDLFWTLLKEPDSLAGTNRTAELGGAYAVWKAWDAVSIAGLYVYEDDPDARLNRHTSGGILRAARGGLKAHLEGYVQTGANGALDTEAYLGSAGAGWHVPEPACGLFLAADYLSGDATPGTGKLRSFNTLYATNHKFYGYLDRFTSFPAHTGGLGLVDLMAKLYGSADLFGRRFAFAADAHRFDLDKADAAGNRRAADELDLTVKLPLKAEGLHLQAGHSTLWPLAALKRTGRTAAESWNYLMATTTF